MNKAHQNAPTIADVAVALGMHKSTVSKALSGKGTISAATQARVARVARELGYMPNPLAQRLAQGESRALVCIVNGNLDVGMGTAKILQVQKELAARGLEVPIYTLTGPTVSGPARGAGEAHAVQIRQLVRQRPRAIVCATSALPSAVFPELETYQRTGGILVCFDMAVPLTCDQVVFDREDNAYQAARWLLECGHRRLGIAMSKLPSGYPEAESMPQTYRFRGFRRALEEFGAPLCQEWLFENVPYEAGGEAMAQRFLGLSKRPTALCIVNDYVALAFMVSVMRAGLRVPEDISLVSHDNQDVTRFCPVPLTSVSQPVERIVQSVIELLIKRIDGYDGPPRTITVRGDLVLRESVTSPSECRQSPASSARRSS